MQTKPTKAEKKIKAWAVILNGEFLPDFSVKKYASNIFQIIDADVYWFSNKKLVYKAMFVFEKTGAFHNLVLITPKLLTLN